MLSPVLAAASAHSQIKACAFRDWTIYSASELEESQLVNCWIALERALYRRELAHVGPDFVDLGGEGG